MIESRRGESRKAFPQIAITDGFPFFNQGKKRRAPASQLERSFSHSALDRYRKVGFLIKIMAKNRGGKGAFCLVSCLFIERPTGKPKFTQMANGWRTNPEKERREYNS
jgi:hypothetical protein